MAILNPSPSAPSRFAAGTGTSSKLTSQTCAPCWPIFLSGLPTETPGRSAGTRKAETPRAPSPPVRAITVNSEALSALVMKRLLPESL